MQVNENQIQQIIGLISKSLSGELSPAEQRVLEDWMAIDESNKKLYHELSNPLYRHEALQEMAAYTDEESALASFFEKHPSVLRVRRNRFVKQMAIVAAAVAAITLGVWLYYASGLFGRHPEGDPPLSSRANAKDLNDIAPGKNTAILKIGDGEAITLSDTKTGVIIATNKLSYNDGSTVGPLAPLGRDGEASEGITKNLTVSTPRGGTYQITLPDGTRVWLNAASRISFPSQFVGEKRKILLEGEAYFEVSSAYTAMRGRKTKQPFVVMTSKQQIEVLGTHFNVNAYTDESVGAGMRTTLLEGSVKVSADGKSMVLQPGTQAYSSPDGLRGLQVNADEAIAWKKGLFSYHNTMLDEVLLQAARWYDVNIVYESVELRQKQLSGSVTRYDKLSNLLNALSYTAGVKFKVEQRTVYVYKK